MLRAAIVKDAVTAFEVYLEVSLDEAFARHARVRIQRPPGESPPWRTLVSGHELLGNQVETDRVKHIRALRHILTHQRGVLRTEEVRKRFAVDRIIAVNVITGKEIWDRAYVGDKVQLSHKTITAVLDDLGSVIREADRQVWAIAWVKAPAPRLDEFLNTMTED